MTGHDETKPEGDARDEYRDRVQEALDRFQAQLDEWRKQADSATADARARFERAVATLRARQDDARARLQEAAKTTGDAWRGAAARAENAVDALGQSFAALAGEIDAALVSAAPAAKAAREAFETEWELRRAERKALLSQPPPSRTTP